MQSMISKTLYLKFTPNIYSDFFWPSNFLKVGGRLVGGWSVWSVVGWSVRRWSVLAGRLVGDFKETPFLIAIFISPLWLTFCITEYAKSIWIR